MPIRWLRFEVLLLLVVWRASSLAAGVARTANTFSENAERILQGELEVEIPPEAVPAELSRLAFGYDEVFHGNN